MAEQKSLRIAYGESLCRLAGNDTRIVCCDADLSQATMTKIFAAEYPQRFFDFGIAEANMMCAAAGMAQSGLIPFVSTFAIFGTARAYEQIRNSIAYANANVKIVCSHAGLCVGEDGGSHQCIEDIALMRVLPNMKVIVPCDAYEVDKAVQAAVTIKGPVYIRVARPVSGYYTKPEDPFIIGRANVLKDGGDVAIFTMGLMVPVALEAAARLEELGIHTAVINHHTLKPFDADCAVAYGTRCKTVVTLEEHSMYGGLGSAAAEAMMGKCGCRFESIAVMDRFGQSGSPALLFKEYGLTAENVVSKVLALHTNS